LITSRIMSTGRGVANAESRANSDKPVQAGQNLDDTRCRIGGVKHNCNPRVFYKVDNQTFAGVLQLLKQELN